MIRNASLATARIAVVLSALFAVGAVNDHAEARATHPHRHAVSVFKAGKPDLGTVKPGQGGSCPRYGVWVKNPKC